MSNRMEFYIKGQPYLPKRHHLKGIGLSNVYLLNGVTFEDDPDYGRLSTITDIPGLHRAIGLKIVTKPQSLAGDELRFLRKQMKLTQEALAEHLHVGGQTVANYEKCKTENLGPADPLVRMLYVLHVLPKEAHASLMRTFVIAHAEGAKPSKFPELVRKKIAGPWRNDGDLLAA